MRSYRVFPTSGVETNSAESPLQGLGTAKKPKRPFPGRKSHLRPLRFDKQPYDYVKLKLNIFRYPFVRCVRKKVRIMVLNKVKIAIVALVSFSVTAFLAFDSPDPVGAENLNIEWFQYLGDVHGDAEENPD